jgi:hypothetical protein
MTTLTRNGKTQTMNTENIGKRDTFIVIVRSR